MPMSPACQGLWPVGNPSRKGPLASQRERIEVRLSVVIVLLLRALEEAHGGTLTLEDAPGAKFVLRLPTA